jgi:hypothetical protein
MTSQPRLSSVEGVADSQRFVAWERFTRGSDPEGSHSLTDPTHRVTAVSGKRGKRYLELQHLLELGETAHIYLTELVHRRPRLWVRDVERLQALLQNHAARAMTIAFEEALLQRTFGAEYVAHYLRHNGTPLLTSQQELPL